MVEVSVHRWTIGVAVIATFGLSIGGCSSSGGDDDEPPPPAAWSSPPPPPPNPAPGATVTGYFKDAGVQGLDFQSGGLTGTTGSRGEFQFAFGSTVTFRVGGVTLGTAPAAPFMTAMNLASPGADVVNQIRNMHRYLQMLDVDGNPDNGITISEAVRAVAQNWEPVDFTTADLDAAVEQMVLDASAADGTTHLLPTAEAADAHFLRTFSCSYSGLYRGSYTGSGDNGVFVIAVFNQGRMRGVGFSNVDREWFDLQRNTPMAITIFPTFSAGFTGTGATFSGRFDNPDVMRGTWTAGTSSGAFLGSRVSTSDDPLYRFTGWTFPQGFPLMLVNVEISSTDQVRADVIDTNNGVPVQLNGAVSGTAINAAGGRFTMTGTVRDLDSPTARGVSVNVQDSVRGASFGLSMNGCRI